MAKTNEPIDAAVKERRSQRLNAATRALELRGKKVSWVGLESPEPLRRGCDHSAWFEKLASDGVRHVLVPLNGETEDSCLFARRHVAGGRALYDLEHRDEGFFTRLKFMLEAVADTGVLLGLSLFDARAGLLSVGGNVQGLSLDSARMRELLETAAGWVCSIVRGSPGVYLEVFRNAGADVSETEREVVQKIAEAFSKQGEDLSPERLGPWVVMRRGVNFPENLASQGAPFDATPALGLDALEKKDGAACENFFSVLESVEGNSVSFRASARNSTTLLRFGEGVLSGERQDWLWRALFRGYWPVAALPADADEAGALRNDVSALAKFSLAWLRRSVPRACADLFGGQDFSRDKNPPFAAEDGSGRYFVYFSVCAPEGVRMSLPAGSYRYAWVNPLSGRCLDRGDGVAGGRRANLPGIAGDQPRLLVIESSELPDGLATI